MPFGLSDVRSYLMRTLQTLHRAASKPKLCPSLRPTFQYCGGIDGPSYIANADLQGRVIVDFLREKLGLTGTHVGCDTAQCGSCTVHVDGRAVKACNVLLAQVNGAHVVTIEGLAAADGTMHPMQAAFKECHGLQCGFCTPGMITRAYRLLQENPSPTEKEIRFGISGNLCRCTGYQNIVKAIQYAAAKLAGVPYQEAAE